MGALFHFEVHTPYRLFFSDSIESLTITLSDGEKGVLANHSPFTAPVVPCLLRITDDRGLKRSAFITEGILEVTEVKTVLMVDTAEWPEEIDTERAALAKKTAEEDSKSAMFKFETESAKARLRRAEFRLKAAALVSDL